MSSGPFKLSDETRMELAGGAGASARRNRPLWLILLGGAMLGLALVYALYGLSLGGVATAALARQSTRAGEIEQLVGKINGIKQSESASSERYRLDPALASKLETAARDVGLTMSISLNEDDKNNAVKNYRRRKLTIDSKGQTAPALLGFLDRASSDVQGLELAYIRLTPGAVKTEAQEPTWDATLRFTRWEQRP